MFGKNKEENYYFKGFQTQCDYALNLAVETRAFLGDFDKNLVFDKMNQMHEIEHSADGKQHEIIEKLAKEFLAPIEREDIVMMAQQLDDLIDDLEDIMVTIYEYDISNIDDRTLSMVNLILESLEALQSLLAKFEGFKKDDSITAHLRTIYDKEEEGDDLFRDSIHNLFANETDIKLLLARRELYRHLETVLDEIKDIANLVESIIMKNS